jgi:hypothetical protein
VVAAVAVLNPDVTNCSDDPGVRGRSRVEQVHCRRFKGKPDLIDGVVQILDVRFFFRRFPEILASGANFPSCIKPFRKILVQFDRRVDRIVGGGGQGSGGDCNGNGADGCNGEEVPPRLVDGREHRSFKCHGFGFLDGFLQPSPVSDRQPGGRNLLETGGSWFQSPALGGLSLAEAMAWLAKEIPRSEHKMEKVQTAAQRLAMEA